MQFKGFTKRTVLFIITFGIAIGIVSYGLISNNVQNSVYTPFFSALLGGIIPLGPFVYIAFVEKPDLEAVCDPSSNSDVHTPIFAYILGKDTTTTVERKHLRVVISNIGQKVAKSCSATIKIDKDGRLDNCVVFSSEPKTLKWVSPIGINEMLIDIAPHGGEQFLEIIFSDNRLYDPLGGECGIEGKKAPLRAFASTPSAYSNLYSRNQDGFCQGRFNIILTVYSETAKPITTATMAYVFQSVDIILTLEE